MKFEERILFFVWEERHIDYYFNFVHMFPGKLIIIVLNDFLKKNINLSSLPEEWRNNYEIKLLSSLLKDRKKYAAGISTGFQTILPDSIKNKILNCLLNFYINFIENKSFSAFFLSKFNKDISGSQLYKRLLLPPERLLVKKLAYFPRGLDFDTDHPGDFRRRYFDLFFCHSQIDESFVTKNTKGKPTVQIGYPRYDLKFPSSEDCKKELCKEFSIPPEKEIILWTPSRIDWQRKPLGNISIWSKFIHTFLANENFEIICRPHPHLMKSKHSVFDNLKNNGVKIDKNPSRNMSVFYRASSLVLADYGGTIFSAIYCSRPVILLNLPEQDELAPKERSDIVAREKIRNFYPNEESASQIMSYIENINKHISEADNLRNFYFSDADKNLYKKLIEISNELLEK